MKSYIMHDSKGVPFGALSRKVARKVRAALCDYTGCQCGGGYGDGPDANSAVIDDTIDNRGEPIMYVVPA